MCNFTSSSDSLLSDSGCLPEIYLVSGHTTCSSLPQTVTAKKLAEIHQTGEGQTIIDISWSDLTDSCVIIARRNSCDEPEAVDNNTEPPEETTYASFRETESCERLRIISPSFFRTFTTINLSGFTVLLTGSVRTVNIVSFPSSGTVTFSGVTVTNYNPFATLPLLQLPGLNGATAVTIAISMFIAYYGAALFSAASANRSKWKKSQRLSLYSVYIGASNFRHRNGIEAEDPLFSIIDRTLFQINKYWTSIKENNGKPKTYKKLNQIKEFSISDQKKKRVDKFNRKFRRYSRYGQMLS